MTSVADFAPRTAKTAGLRYVSCSEPGVARLRKGKGFVYRLPNGKLLRQAQELERIRKLALPPAWRDVWICKDPRGHLLATGVDAR
jgi:DNA topoisomerase-1